MLRPTSNIEVYLYMAPVDMRRSINGLAALVENELALSQMMEVLFVFCDRGRNKIKLLCWERNGFVVWYKRLEKQRLKCPRQCESGYELRDGRDFYFLLDGPDIWRNKPHGNVYVDSVS
jgi:transposase